MREVSRAAIALLALSCLAVQVQPELATVQGAPGTPFEHVFSVINDEARPAEYQLQVHPFSAYLADAATVSEDSFHLLPQDNENIQVRGTIPANLGPETHLLRYEVLEDGRRADEITIEIPVEGTPSLEPALEVRAENINKGSSLVADATLRNFGNIIAYYNLTLAVEEDGEQVGALSYPEPVQVLPGEENEISLIYSDFLEPGDYRVSLRAVVNGEVDLEERTPVRVTLAGEQRSIARGDDLVVELKRYDTQPRVQYAVTRRGEELLSETLVLGEDALTIETSALEPGTYDVSISVAHARGTDTQRFSLEIEDSSAVGGWWAVILGVLALAGALFSRQVRLFARIAWLTARVHLREKRLNSLIRRAHALEREHES